MQTFRIPGRTCPTTRRPHGRPKTCWRDYISQLLWESVATLPEELEEVARESKVLAFPQPNWDKQRLLDRWMVQWNYLDNMNVWFLGKMDATCQNLSKKMYHHYQQCTTANNAFTDQQLTSFSVSTVKPSSLKTSFSAEEKTGS